MNTLFAGSRMLPGSRMVGVLLALTVLAASLTGCKAAPETKPEAKREAPGAFDVTSLKWHPEEVSGVRPSLVAWRYVYDAHGVLVALSSAGETVLWEAPDIQTLVQLEGIAPDGSQMVARVTGDLGDLSTVSHVVFRPDGSVETLPLPRGFEGLSQSAFMGDDVLLLAEHVTPEDFKTKLGVVGPDGEWRDLAIEGEIPSYQFIDAVVTLPGTDIVALVLKVPGGIGKGDVLVLARRSGTELRVFTPPYFEDSLPCSVALRDGQGVAFPKMFSDDMTSDATEYVRVEWTGSEWRESVIAPTTFASVIERGDVIAEDADGGFWVRYAPVGGDETESSLLFVSRGSNAPQDTGIDATNIQWFSWIDGPK